jgi:F-type H+-transporting ATPase subunit epsilon
MAGSFTLRVITPSAIVLDTQVESVRFPGLDGSIGVLPRHAHMIAGVGIGVLQYVEKGQRKQLFVSEGFAEVKDNTMRVVCEAGELPEEIDEERARAAEKRARERLSIKVIGEPAVDMLRAELALQRALMRLEVRGAQPRERVRT